MIRFGETPSESQAKSAAKCRDIVKEIVSFGVSQDEIFAIIQLLSLELENREQMTSLVELCKKYRTNRLVELNSAEDQEMS